MDELNLFGIAKMDIKILSNDLSCQESVKKIGFLPTVHVGKKYVLRISVLPLASMHSNHSMYH